MPSAAEIAALKGDLRKPGELPFAKLCAYGVNGSGKTRLAASSRLPTLLIDCNEEGDRSIKDHASHVRVLPARTWLKIGVAYWWLKSEKHPFKDGVVAIDTVTGMQSLAMDFVLGEAEDRDPSRERGVATKRDWGRAGTLMRGMLTAYRNLPMHVVFLAQERKVRDPDTEEVLEIVPDLPASSRGALTDSVGILGRMMPREVKIKGSKVRQWQDHMFLAPHEVVRTKDRTNALGAIVRRPTLTRIIEAWEANPPTDEED